MKNSSNQLLILIQSLSKSEKVYFKKQNASKTPVTKKYLAIFDYVAKTNTYDEAVLKRKFKIKNLSKVKQYLFEHLRKSLRNYHSEKNARIQLNNYLTDIHIIFKRGLFDYCEELIRRAEKLARVHNHHLAIIQLNEYKHYILGSQPQKYAHLFTTFKEQLKEFDFISSNYRNTLQYSMYKDIFFMNVRLNKELILNEDMEFIIPKEAPRTIQGQLFNGEVILAKAVTERNHKKMKMASMKLVDLYEQEPLFCKEYPSRYIVVLINQINCFANIDSVPFEELDAMLEKVKRILNNCNLEKVSKLEKEAVLGSHLFCIYFKKHRYAEAEALHEIYLTWLKHNVQNIPPVQGVIFYYRLFTGAVYANRYGDALNLSNLIQDSEEAKMRLDVKVYTRLLILLIYFVEDDLLLLESCTHSTYQFIRNNKLKSVFVNLLIGFFKSKVICANFTQSKVKKGLLNALRVEIVTLFEQQPKEKMALNYFQIIRWIDSQLEGKTMEEVTEKTVVID